MRADCIICDQKNLDKNTIGINKKLLGEDIENFYCMDCLAEYLGDRKSTRLNSSHWS